MVTIAAVRRIFTYRSIVFKNILLCLLILLVAVGPLALRYDQDSRAYEIQNLASKLEFFAERGASWLDPAAMSTLTQPEHKQAPAYQTLLTTLQRIEREFEVDNAVVIRREEDGQYTYIAVGHDGFAIRQPVHIHAWFPATYKATNDTWLRGEMMHSQLFGGQVGDQVFDQFLQINTPLKLDGQVVAILMLNKFANPVAAAVRAKTFRVIGLSSGIVALGLLLFGLISARMLRPLKALTAAANIVAQGNLAITVPLPRSRDEVGRLTVTFASMLEGLRQRDFIRDTFGRYLSKEVVATLLESPDGLKLGGEVREVTFLVSDLRGFSSLAARLPPQDVVTIINRYLERMVDVMTHYHGTVDEFQGDGILAFFGAPVAAADDPERAVACALAMQMALVELNAEQRQLRLPELAMGIGMHIGDVIVGNIGSEQRAKYGAMGSEINAAYRIESYTVGGQILISASLYERVRSLVQVRGTQEVQFKGLASPITLYDIGGLGGRYQLTLPAEAPAVFTTLASPLPITCSPLIDKAVAEVAIPGAIIRLATSAAEAWLEEPVAIHTNVKILLASQNAAGFSAVYAKVLALEPADARQPHSTVHLAWTTLAEDIQSFLEQQRTAAQQAGPVPAV